MVMMTMKASKHFKVKDSLYEKTENDDIHKSFELEQSKKRNFDLTTTHKHIHAKKTRKWILFLKLNNLSFIIIYFYCIKHELYTET